MSKWKIPRQYLFILGLAFLLQGLKDAVSGEDIGSLPSEALVAAGVGLLLMIAGAHYWRRSRSGPTRSSNMRTSLWLGIVFFFGGANDLLRGLPRDSSHPYTTMIWVFVWVGLGLFIVAGYLKFREENEDPS